MKRFSLGKALREVHALDWLLLALAVLFAAHTLLYPYGRDQGLYHYVGREWLLGAIPYRDTMDQKTPVIYLVFGLANLIFGEHLWSIRLVELLWVLTFGWFFAGLLGPRGEPKTPGLRGLGSLLIAMLYFGVLSYWDTAQCEIWCAGFAFLSFALVERYETPVRGPLVAGVWAGLACLAKPPAVFLVMIVVLALATRAWLRDDAEGAAGRLRRTAVALVAFGAGAALPTLLTVLYFWAAGALTDFYDVVVLCNAYYREHERPPLDLTLAIGQLQDAWLRTYPISVFSVLATLVALGIAVRLRSLAIARRYLLAFMFPFAGVAAVLLQGLYFPYHWGMAYVGWSVVLLLAVHDLTLLGPSLLKQPVSQAWFSGVSALLLLIAYSSSGVQAQGHYGNVKLTYQYVRGQIDKAAFDSAHNVPNWYDWSANVAVADWLNTHADPADLIATRMFEPAIYALTERSSDLRFFWTSWLSGPNRMYRREEWLAQDKAQLKTTTPRFAITIPWQHAGPDSIEYFWPFGTWTERLRVGAMVVYERTSDQPQSN